MASSDGPAGGIPDVLVVGAGPTGLLAAILLARSGVRLRILDRNPDSAQQSRAFALQARSLEILGSIGLAEAILERGLLAAGARVHVEGHLAAELTFDDIGRRDTPFPFITAIPQSEIELILGAELERLEIRVERGLELLGLTQDAEGIQARVRMPKQAGESVIQARYVLGADGAHSIVRKSLGLTFEGAAYAQSFLLADCQVGGLEDPGRISAFLGREGFAMVFPLRGRGGMRVIASQPGALSADPGLAGQGLAPATLEEVEAAFRDAAKPGVSLSDATWVSRYRVHHRAVDSYRRGRGFVAGDAAHIHSPAGGQGMNTGLQDAANLAWKLAAVIRGGAPEALLDSYQAERWPVGQKLLEVTDRLFERMTARAPVAVWLRNLAVPVVAGALSHLGPVRARAFAFISQLGIRYEPGPDVVEAGTPGWDAGPGAGRRAPDARVAPGLDLFRLIEGYGFSVLGFSRAALGEEEIAAIAASCKALPRPAAPAFRTIVLANSLVGRDPRLVRVEGGDVFQAYGLGPATPRALYLVRPDGYVAWRADRLDFEGLARFLRARLGGVDAPP